MFGYAVFAVLYWTLSSIAHYLTIAVVAHFLAVAQSFVTHRQFVFRASGACLPQYLRFNVASIMALSVNLALLYLLVDVTGAGVLIGQAIATAITVLLSYLLHLHFSFRTS